jgi:hypothetical protein
MKYETYADEVMLSEQELVPNHIKVQSLNTFKYRLDELKVKTKDKIILNAISTLYQVINDAYNISMYKFAFKILTLTLSKEIDTLEKMVQFNG